MISRGLPCAPGSGEGEVKAGWCHAPCWKPDYLQECWGVYHISSAQELKSPCPFWSCWLLPGKGLSRSGPSNAPSGHRHLPGLQSLRTNESFAGFFISLFFSLFLWPFHDLFSSKTDLESLLWEKAVLSVPWSLISRGSNGFLCSLSACTCRPLASDVLPNSLQRILAHTSTPFSG